MLNVLIVQEKLPHYRVAFFNELSKKYCLTLVVTEASHEKYNFDVIQLPVTEIWKFKFIRGLGSFLKERKFDVIIAVYDLRFLNLWISSIRMENRRKWIWWGVDLGRSRVANLTRKTLFKLHRFYIFYSYTTFSKFSKSIGSKRSAFVANNSVEVREEKFLEPGSSYFLNVGSLNARKRNDLLILAFYQFVSVFGRSVRLVFVGSGDERRNLEVLVANLGLKDLVDFIPHIEVQSDELSRIYENAICSISLGQAGLSILQSFGYSRPFISLRNAVSGGELSNIIHGYNGFLCSDLNHVVGCMLRVVEDDCELLKLSKNSYQYYWGCSSLSGMCEAFSAAVQGVARGADGLN